MVLSFLSPLTPPGLSSDSPLLWEALQDLPHWMHSLHSPISALISLECHVCGQVSGPHWTVSLGHGWVPSTGSS